MFSFFKVKYTLVSYQENKITSTENYNKLFQYEYHASGILKTRDELYRDNDATKSYHHIYHYDETGKLINVEELPVEDEIKPSPVEIVIDEFKITETKTTSSVEKALLEQQSVEDAAKARRSSQWYSTEKECVFRSNLPLIPELSCQAFRS